MEQRYAIPGFPRNALVRVDDGTWQVYGPRGLLKGHKKHGRKYFNLVQSSGQSHHTQLGRIVLLATVGPPPTQAGQCCHIDGDPENNDPSNLRWGTAKDNAADRERHGRTVRGERSTRSVLAEEQVRAIRAEYQRGSSEHGTVALAARYGVSKSTVHYVVTSQRWAHVEDRPSRSSA